MCGIAGIYQKNGQPDRDLTQRMTDALRHRGPDAEGFFTDDHIALGHRRLSILDLSDAANQPMFSADGRYVMVFNGEVYNFRELAKELNVPLKTTGDTEVVLEAFVQWGPAFVERLNGMFALAIYDLQEGKLYVCRDRIGIKPLYYYHQDDLFLFASELKALLTHPSIANSKQINKRALSHYLYLGYVPEPDSMFEGIRKFPKGAYGMVSGVNLKIQKYWSPDDYITSNVIRNEQQAKKELKSLLESSLRYRLISDVPYGTFLSGGIDSSLVTAVAQSVSDQPINTFSIGFTEAKFNEAEHARKVASHLGTNHHEFTVSQKEVIDLFEDIIDVYDEPFSDSSSVPTMLVSKLARQHVTMTLSGDGGDETYMGYGFYRWADRLNRPIVKAFRAPIAAGLSKGKLRHQRAALMFRYGKERLKSHIFSQEQYCFTEREINGLVEVPFRHSIEIEEAEGNLPRKLDPKEAQALFDLQYYLPDDLLVKVDRASMRYSLENRVPLLDHRLIEFALNVDHQLKMTGNDYKVLLKSVLFDYVPENYFNRPKWGFGMPLVDWLYGDLKYLLDDYLSKEIVQAAGILKWGEAEQLRKAFLNGKTYLYNRIWIMILLHRWYLKNF